MFIVIGQQIPPLFEYFNSIRFHGEGITSGLPEFPVGYRQFVVLLHGIDDSLKVLFPCRYVFQHDAVSQRTTFHKHVADGKGVE